MSLSSSTVFMRFAFTSSRTARNVATISERDSEASIRELNLSSSPFKARLKIKTIFEDTETIFLVTIAVNDSIGGGSFLLGSELLFGQLSCALLLAELFLAGCAHVIKSSQLSSCVFAGNR